MSASKLQADITLEFVTTEKALTDAGSVDKLAQQSERVRFPIKNAAGVAVTQLTLDELGDLYRNAHRLQGLKTAMFDIAKSTTSGIKTIGIGTFKGIEEGRFALAAAYLQLRCYWSNREKLDRLQAKLNSQAGLYSQEELEAIQMAMTLTKLGMNDNVCGIAGGIAEAAAAGCMAVRAATVVSAGLLVVASWAGAGGAFMNARQNFEKAKDKWKENNRAFTAAYAVPTVLYSMAGVSLFGAGIEIAVHWWITRTVLQTGLRGAAGAGVAAAGAEGISYLGLSLTGWGLVFTIGAFTVEGIVTYCDRTKLEAWVESSYFGTSPKWRAMPPPGKSEDPARWDNEYKALVLALQAAQAEAQAQ